jgi:hypothetical protein
MIDGLSVQAVMRSAADHAAVRDLVVTTTERELGLRPGDLALPSEQPTGHPERRAARPVNR